jgi:RNA polymerase sigma-70 factor (ECF subfamily)
MLAYRRRRREVLRDLVDPPDLKMNPEQLLEAEQARKLVQTALQAVPYERRAVFVMHELDDTSMHDIAKALRIPLFTAYSRLRKARREFELVVTQLLERWP